ncbi:cell wall hydrolase/autolysin [Streptococcus suis]|uniref:GBS Bsp-like repeat-containing protein n=2 Tax=Streptococcus suis TaxID=1307 RepID=UPI0007689BEF|nr:GBS Bsp-like repeat-containing protein [Streptococcus suis]CYT85671.1 cell wall hydrolase/autolysin [Streptococcus suis]
MKKKSLLFLSLCAWTLQSHLVQADTIVDTASQASQETEMSSLSNSNIAVSQRTSLTVANEGAKQSKTLVAENTTVSSLQTPSSEIVGSANSMSELTNQGESISDSTTISNEVKPDQETTSSNAISVTSGVSLTKENASVASSTSSTSAGTGNTVTTPSTNVAARSTVSSSSQLTTSTQASNVVAIENVNAVNGSFDVRVSKVSSPKEIKEVYIPTWSEVNGQDDIIWYAAKRQLDGSYLINVDNAQHKKSVGKYHSHVYYLATDGSLSAIGATSAVLPELKASGKVSAVNVNRGAGSFEIKISDIVAPKGIAKVLVPTWTESGGQDDIVWHEASRQSDDSYLARINKTQHKNELGNYISHVYLLEQDGSLSGIGATSTVLPELKASGKVSAVNVNQGAGSFEVKISDIVAPKGIAKVLVPTWTESGGQDDIVWHEASRQSDGSYLARINKTQHKYESGKYISHVYYRGHDGSMTAIGGASVELPELKLSGTITVSDVNVQAGSFNVRITNISSPRGLDKVYVPTWTESGGQDDIVWHEASRQSDGSYLARINKNQHKYSSGKYISHVYYRGTDGSMTAVGGTSVELPSTRSYTVYIDPGHGGRDSGASYGGVHEKNLALSVSNKLRENLLQYGINVLMTRTGDYDVDFKTERSRMTNASNADLFISIHFNATGAGVSNSTGIETYWYQYDPEYQPKINKEMHNNPTRLAESEILANKVQESLIKETGAVDRGVRRETFAVLRETAIPAILVELGFMDNPSELQVIKQDSYHTRLAKALAQGVMNWYGAVEGK